MKRAILLVILCSAVIAALVLRPQGEHTFSFPTQTLANPVSVSTATSRSAGDPEDWPQWRGVERDGHAASRNLLEEWPAEGPPLVWKTTGMGSGMSSVAVVDQSLLTLGQRDGATWLVCRNTADGSERWATNLGRGGEPNATPTIDGDRVFAITRKGKISCASLATGDILWTRDFVSEFGGSEPTWGYSESPLVDRNQVICTPGADEALMVALDRDTGKTIWQSQLPEAMQNKGHGGAGYASPVVSDAADIHHYVQMFGGGAVGVSATDGTTLWGYSRVANRTAVIPTPLVQDDLVFVSSGYGTGAALLQLERTASGLKPEEIYFHGGNRVQNHHGGMVLVDGYVYLGHGHNQGHPLCLELKSGTVRWGPLRGPGSGSPAVAVADDHLYFRYENAKMALIEVNPSDYRLKSVFEIPSRLGKSWPHPVIARQRLYLRDQDVLLCYDLAKSSAEAAPRSEAPARGAP